MAMDLSESDVQALLDAVGELALPGDRPALRQRTVELLPGVVPNDMTAWNEVDVDRGSVFAVCNPPIDPARVDLGPVLARYADQHPVIAYYRRTGDGRPHAISDFVTAQEFNATELYQQFYVYVPAQDQMSMVLPDPAMLIGIALNRDWKSFTERDRTLLNLIRPHLLQAYRNAVAFERTQRYLATLDTIVEANGEGLIVLDEAGRVEHVTPGAAAMLHHYFPDTDGLIPTNLTEWIDTQQAMPSEPAPAYVRGDSDSRLHIRQVLGANLRPTALLLRNTPGGEPDRTTLIALGLTNREAETARLLIRGLTNALIASELSISVRTVEKHVHATFEKLGVANRVQATLMLCQLGNSTTESK